VPRHDAGFRAAGDVRPVFNQSLLASGEADRKRNEARSEAEIILSRSRTDTSEILGAARTYETRVVNEAEAEADKVRKFMEKLGEDPSRLRPMLYLHALDKITAALERPVYITVEKPAPGQPHMYLIAQPDELAPPEDTKGKRR